jgi:parvulin-like peptidyl-prolyl isomerase
LQRLALLGFAALLILLFAIFAIAQGIGHPSVPSDSVAVVEDAPSGLGNVTKKEFEHTLAQAAAENEVTPVPKPGDSKYKELKEAALTQLIESIWIQGEAGEMGISVTDKEVADELKKLKEKSFKTAQEYKEFLKKAKFTPTDVNTRVKLQMLSEQIRAKVEEAPIPGNREIENYYEAAKSTQFTTPESRDIRVVKNKDEAKVEAAKAALEKDDSEKSWEKVAKKYSTDTTKGNGGLQSSVT